VQEPFRVTFTFTDEDHDGTQYGVEGFDLDDVKAKYSGATYPITLADFREDKPGLVYSALMDQMLDATLRIQVEAGAAESTHDGQESGSAQLSITVEVPEDEAPTGEEIWSAEMTVRDYELNAVGYIGAHRNRWKTARTYGNLSDGDDATDDDAFTYAGKNYTVGEVSFVSSWGWIHFITCPGLEGADATFDLYLDDLVDSQRDLSLNFDLEEVKTYRFSVTIDGASQPCTQYRWQPRKVDWKEGGKVNVRLLR